MKILLLTQVLPYPPDSGPKVKTWNVLKYLAQRHDITLVSFTRGDQSLQIAHLQRYCRAVHTVPIRRGKARDAWAMGRSLVTGVPWTILRDDQIAMHQLITCIVANEQFDIVHADQVNMCQYVARVPNCFKLFDAHNALWLLYRRLADTMALGLKKWLLQREWALLKAYEGQLCREFDAVTVVTVEDQVALQAAAGEAVDICTIPITVDLAELQLVTPRADANHVVHIGTMYWPPNIDGVLWFARDIWPHVHTQRPDSIFHVIGSRPAQQVRRLAQPQVGIHVPGYVDDLHPYLEQAGVFVVPLRAGGGMRVKILNALAQGLPIVSTSIGCEGIQVTHEQDILIADTPLSFAEAILRILEDRELAGRLRLNGRRLVERVYDYRVACSPLEDIYHMAARSGGR